jgi:6-phosphofructokinase 2
MTAPRILTITLNPALDLSTRTGEVSPGPKLRCEAPKADPGGGGVNVSRAIRFLGGRSLALAALGGSTGDRLHDLLVQEGIDVLPLPAAGETRTSLSVTEDATGAQFRFVMAGPVWTASHAAEAAAAASDAMGAGDLSVVSGSLPPGAPDDLILTLGRAARAADGRAILDTSGPALIAVAGARDGAGLILRMDRKEAQELAGVPLPDLCALADFAQGLRVGGVADIVVVASGADGSVCVGPPGRFHAVSPKSEVISAVGAGDSFVGAFALALHRGDGLQDALRFGTAAAAAAVKTPGTRLCEPDEVARLLPLTTLTRV